jgi:hypothetical protein
VGELLLANMNKVAPAPSDPPRVLKVAWSNEPGEATHAVERPPSGDVVLSDESLPVALANDAASLSRSSSSATPLAPAPSSSVTITSQPLRAHEIDAVPDISAAVSSERMVMKGAYEWAGVDGLVVCVRPF